MLDVGFYNWLIARGYSEITSKADASRIGFLTKVISPFNKDGFQQFIVANRDHYSNNSFNLYLNRLRRYDLYMGTTNFKGLKTLPNVRGRRTTFTTEEINRFLSTTVSHSHGCKPGHSYNWDLFWGLLALSGARPIEICRLKVEDCSFAEGLLYFNHTKTNEPRKVPIPEPYVKMLADECSKHKDKLFPAMRHQYYSVQFHYRLNNMGLKRAGLSPYSFRHSYATTMLSQPNVSLFDAMALLGHKSVTTTQLYVHIATERLKRVVHAHPLIQNSCNIQEKARFVCDIIRGLGLEFEPETTYKGTNAMVKLIIRPPPPTVGGPAVAKH